MKASAQVVGTGSATYEIAGADRLFQLDASQLLHIRDGKGTLLRVVAGTVWLTQDHDPLDRVLEAGQDFVLDRQGLAVLVPLGGTPVRVVVNLASAVARRELRWLPLGRSVRPA